MTTEGPSMTSYLMTAVTFVLSVPIFELYEYEMKCQMFTLKIKVKVKKQEKWKLGHSTACV